MITASKNSHKTAPPAAGLIESFPDAQGRTLAIVIRSQFATEKYNFVTPPESSLQVGVSFYQPGETIQPHLQPEQNRAVTQSQECIVVRKGEMTLFVFDANRNLVAETVLYAGDVLLQSAGGHAFKVNKNTEIVEVKQGPFGGESDKIRFECDLP